MKRKHLIAGTLGVVIAAAIPLAFSQDGPPPRERDGKERGERMLQELDTNGDGEIAKSEIDARRAEAFAKSDTNGDGVITPAEFEAAAEARKAEREARRREAMFSRLDTDGDGAVSEAEFTTREMKMFERADADGDGVITAEELEEMRGKGPRGPRRGPRGNRRGGE